MIREVPTVSHIAPDIWQLDLECGHSIQTDRRTRDFLLAEAMKERRQMQVDCKVCDNLVFRLHKRADIRRSIPHRKSVQDNQPDRIADLLDEAGFAMAELLGALKPFAECIEYINPEEDDEEWAKFRLLIRNYRLAAETFNKYTMKENDNG